MAQEAGIKDSALGCDETGGRVPEWLEKWAALTCAFVAEERRLLPLQLATLPPPNYYPPAEAEIQARGARHQLCHPSDVAVSEVLLDWISDMLTNRRQNPVWTQLQWTGANLVCSYDLPTNYSRQWSLPFQLIRLSALWSGRL